MWAKSIGGDAAVKLLNKHGMLMEGIDFACETGAFDLAFDLARIGAKDRMGTVHVRLATQLEEEGRLEDASKHYVEGSVLIQILSKGSRFIKYLHSQL